MRGILGTLAACVLVLAASVVAHGRRGDGSDGKQTNAELATGALRFSRVRLATGVELQVAEVGPAGGRPVLFLHGITDSWFSFARILDGLPADVRAIVPSQRGHGDSERPACCYGVMEFTADAVALLDAMGVARADVVGHSMGSFIAQRMAIEYPERVARLVLVGSGNTVATPAVIEYAPVIEQLTDPIPTEFAREFQAGLLREPLPPAFLDRVVDESLKVPARIWRDALRGLLAGDARGELGRIRAQTLVVWGEHDPMWTRAHQDTLVGAIPDARLLAYPHVSHSPHWEDPARFLADLARFLEAGTAAPVRREHAAHAHEHAAGTGPMPLLSGLGEWQHAITTRVPDAQRYFDQGLRLAYAFNHDEAVRSFERALELDPGCAMCHWGLAYALGPNINLPMDAAAEPRALAAIRRATSLKQGTTALESALIDALALRYGEPAGEARAGRDSAYAAAMRRVALRFPDDADAQVLFADAMLNLRPWNQWTRAGQPQPGTMELVRVLEHVIEKQRTHAGACHLYVHAVEASPTPERALPCAERLPRLMPGAGHIVHMPAHVYLRVGRYEDAARANIAAVAADAQYFARHDVAPGLYPLFYAPHNLHFLWAAYLLSGQRAKALGAARALVERVALEDARQAAALEAFLPAPVLTLARFRDWKGVLAEPVPPADLRYVRGMWHYARGLAHAGLGDVPAARAELDSVRAIAGQAKDDLVIILNPAPALLKLAAEVLAGEIAAKQRRTVDAVAHFRSAVALEDALTYDEPPPWYHSTRNILGDALLESGRFEEAEAVFRDDLWFVRENGWSLAGLERALAAQKQRADAAEVRRRLARAWQHADSPVYPRAP